jgi:hypothetical protein
MQLESAGQRLKKRGETKAGGTCLPSPFPLLPSVKISFGPRLNPFLLNLVPSSPPLPSLTSVESGLHPGSPHTCGQLLRCSISSAVEGSGRR